MKIYDLAELPYAPFGIQQLIEQSTSGSFFDHPAWYRLVGESAAGPSVRFYVDDMFNLGLACCHASGGKQLHSCTNLYTVEFDLLGEPGIPAAVARFAREIASSIGSANMDLIRLEGLDPARASFPALLDGFRSGGLVAKPYFAWAVWFDRVAGTSFEEYFAARPSALRNTCKRRAAAAQKSGHAEFKFYDANFDPEPLVSVYEGLREKSWKSQERIRSFVPGVIRMAATLGALRFGVLSIDGIPAAAQFWLVWRGRATIFKLVHSEKLSHFSPGTLLTMEMIKRILERDRPAEINFGRGDDRYKQLWVSMRRECWGIEAANPRTLRGLALSAWLRLAILRQRLRGSA